MATTTRTETQNGLEIAVSGKVIGYIDKDRGGTPIIYDADYHDGRPYRGAVLPIHATSAREAERKLKDHVLGKR